MTTPADIHLLDAGTLVAMYELDLREISGVATDRYFFHPGLNSLLQPLVWQGVTYQPYPVEASGFETNAKGTLPRPTLVASNVTGAIGILARQYDDLVGARIIRRRTFGRYLDAVNFPGGVNPTADPTQHLPDDVYYVERKVRETPESVEFELSSAMDLHGFKVPNRVVTVGSCSWQYRAWNAALGRFVYGPSPCPYAGSAYFDSADVATTDPAKDSCSRSVAGCKARFGDRGLLPYGGFPAARAYKL